MHNNLPAPNISLPAGADGARERGEQIVSLFSALGVLVHRRFLSSFAN